MRINKERPHLLVLPEDDANRQILNGFLDNSKNLKSRAIQVLPVARGWKKVLEKFTKDYARTMYEHKHRLIVLLIDFDQEENRLDYVKKHIPDNLKNRVFVLGVWSEPESLRSNIKKNFEEIGETLANDCPENTSELWSHELLKHNKAELERMVPLVKQFLFN